MNKRDIVAGILNNEHKTEKPESGFVQIVSFANQDCPWSDELLQEMRQRRKKKSKNFAIEDIVPMSHKDLPHYCSSFQYKTTESEKKKTPIFSERSGMFRIKFNDGSIMLFAKWFSGGGKGTMLESMFASEREVWNKWLKLFQSEKKRRAKPRIGVYRIYKPSDGPVTYEKMKNIPNNPIFHTELERIKSSVQYYFENVPSFMKYNQPGRRSLLLYGEQGTSKTSTLYQLAKIHQKDKCVVFSTDINAVASHVMACEKYNMPTLAFFEDAEGVFQHNNSDVKNFLSGIDARQNKGGTCLVYTTNYPEKMEESIVERPERIDELHYIGPIEGDTLVDCAKFYFGDYLPESVNLSNVLTKPMTGAEMKLLVENTLRYCASNREEISEDSIRRMLNKYVDDIKQLKDFTTHAKRTLANKSKANNKMGFTEDVEDFAFTARRNGD